MNNPMQDKFMLERLHKAVEHAEHKTLPSIEEQLKQAKEKAIELGELSRDEADKVADYLRRDLDDVSLYLQEGEWLNLVADKTKLEWDKIKLRAVKSQLYHSGEIIGAGSIECIACEQTLNFKKTGHIPPCPKCHKTEFKRQHAKEPSA